MVVWEIDYDFKKDKCFRRPMHKECYAPVVLDEGKYICIGCGQEMELTPDMIEWISERAGVKIEHSDCEEWEFEGKKMGCGGKGTVEEHYMKNPITLEWQFCFSECKKCGNKIMV